MIDKVTLADIGKKIAERRDGRIGHEELISWAREAMMATEFPPAEAHSIMELLQDIARSSSETIKSALRNYDALDKAGVIPEPPDIFRN